MNTTAPAPTRVAVDRTQRLPIVTLVVLAAIGFVLVAMETMPAGLLPVIATGLDTSEGAVGLFVSAYALGTVLVNVDARIERDPAALVRNMFVLVITKQP